jgi:hypothetical protein
MAKEDPEVRRLLRDASFRKTFQELASHRGLISEDVEDAYFRKILSRRGLI